MLTLSDKKFIQNTIKDAFQDFYENIFEPHVQRHEQQHTEILSEIKIIKREIKTTKTDSDRLQDAVYELTLLVKNHEIRLQKLETQAKF